MYKYQSFYSSPIPHQLDAAIVAAVTALPSKTSVGSRPSTIRAELCHDKRPVAPPGSLAQINLIAQLKSDRGRGPVDSHREDSWEHKQMALGGGPCSMPPRPREDLSFLSDAGLPSRYSSTRWCLFYDLKLWQLPSRDCNHVDTYLETCFLLTSRSARHKACDPRAEIQG